jgi:predicted DNA-binding transcriptional regulator AlpA
MNAISIYGYGASASSNPLSGYRDLLSVDDLSEIFSVNNQTIHKELKKGRFGKPIRMGRAYKVPKIHIVSRFFASHQ